MRQSRYVRAPFYFFLSVIFSFSVWSLLFPHIFGDNDSASAASFATATSVTSVVPDTAKTKLLSVGGTYYLAFTITSTANTSLKSIFITTSTNGVSWSTPVRGLDLLAVLPGPVQAPVEFGFVYNTVKGEFALSGGSDTSSNVQDVVFTTSSNAFAWSATTTIVRDTGGSFTNPQTTSPIAFSTTTGMYAVGFIGGCSDSSPQAFCVATSSNGVTWNSSSIQLIDAAAQVSGEWLADVREVSVIGNQEIHVVYDNAVSNSTRFYEIMYATSTNAGNTWTTTTVTGRVQVPSTGSPFTMRDITRAAINHDGKASIMYYDLMTYTGGGGSISGTIVYAHRSNTTSLWTTSTLDSSHKINSMSGATLFNAAGITYYANDRVALAYYSETMNEGGQRLIEFAAQVTNTTFADTGSLSISNDINSGSEISVAYRTSTQVIAFAFVNNFTIKFTTSSLRSADLNNIPSSTPFINPSVSTGGGENGGNVTVTTTISDSDSDEVTLSVEYSTNGTTWSAATINSTTLGSGSAGSGNGSITSIDSSPSGNTVAFVWSSSSDLPDFATTTTKIRIRASDAYGGVGSYVTSANFEIDDLAPSSTSFTLVDTDTASTTLYWAGVSGANSYYVSSTATSSFYLVTASSTTLTALTPNTLYTHQIFSVDAFSNTSDASSVTSTYTDAAVPTAFSATVASSQSISLSWTSTNGSSSQYQIYNVTTGAVVATTTAVSYTVTELSRNTSYQFTVRTKYKSDTSTYSSSATSTAVTTSGGGDDSGGGGGGGSSPSPSTGPVSVTKSFTLNAPTPLSVGGATHSVNVSKATDSGATVTIKSDPITVSVTKGETKELDTDKDGVIDLRVSYQGLTTKGQATFTFVPLVDLTELLDEMTINKGLYETSDREITISFNTSNFTVSKAVKMAVSETNDFTKLELVPFEKTKKWTLTEGLGKKTIYVRLRTSEGTSAVISDSINLIKATSQATPDTTEDDSIPPVTDTTPDENEVPLSTCGLEIGGAYKAEGAPAVYYITNKCQKRAFTSATKYLTYFTSWKDVQTVAANKLNSLANDTLGFMPWGPLWKPQWGAIVKHPGDPKVYLLLNNEKYWITSEIVFEGLYSKDGWTWVEDVDPKLLDNYATGSEINYTYHHPNYTVIKYAGSAMVYRLEPDVYDADKQVKRHIANEAAFNKLGFRWDRIVMLKDYEQYADGTVLE